MKNGLFADKYGDRYWYKDDLLHREDGPAVEWESGTKFWYFDGKCHREDGPAVEGTIGYKVWCYHGERINCSSQEEFERLMKLKAFW